MSSVRKKDQQEHRFTVLDAILDMYDHTIQVTSNPKIFLPEHEWLTSQIKAEARMKFMGNGICAKYKWVQVLSWSQVGDGEMSVTNSEQSPILRVHDSTAGTDAAAFKTAMSGVYLVYELATPTTEEAEPYQNPQIVDDFGTEEFVDTRDVAVPVGHSTRYQPNLRAKLEMMPNSPDGDGDYIVRQTSGENEYVALASNATIQVLMAKLPSAPSEDGAYKLTCTVTNGTAVYSWEAE